MRTQLVTIGITCFNAASTIERALQSAFRQDWPNIDILIVDDASSDGSTAIIDGLIANRREARLIRHATNTGPAGARNTILAEAKGEFIVFLDDDDEALPGRVAGQVLCLEAYEKRSGAGLVACYASGTRVYCNGYRLDLPAIGSLGQAVPKGSGMVDFLLLYRRRPDWCYGTGTPSCSILARRSTFAAVGGFDSEFRRVEDADFAIRLALKGGHFIGTPQRLFIQHSTAAPDKAPERNL
ncbi:MAG: glycosyltransferase, partial [Lysobacterales bacterium]